MFITLKMNGNNFARSFRIYSGGLDLLLRLAQCSLKEPRLDQACWWRSLAGRRDAKYKGVWAGGQGSGVEE